MTERRTADDRRTNHAVPEPLERQAQRRQGDRRDSPRLPVQLEVHAAERECERMRGDLGLNGASFITERPPRGDDIVVTCRVPALDTPSEPALELVANARVVSREVRGSKTLVHVTFSELPVAVELALAKWLDAQR